MTLVVKVDHMAIATSTLPTMSTALLQPLRNVLWRLEGIMQQQQLLRWGTISLMTYIRLWRLILFCVVPMNGRCMQ
jgi:hypothetical protein